MIASTFFFAEVVDEMDGVVVARLRDLDVADADVRERFEGRLDDRRVGAERDRRRRDVVELQRERAVLRVAEVDVLRLVRDAVDALDGAGAVDARENLAERACDQVVQLLDRLRRVGEDLVDRRGDPVRDAEQVVQALADERDLRVEDVCERAAAAGRDRLQVGDDPLQPRDDRREVEVLELLEDVLEVRARERELRDREPVGREPVRGRRGDAELDLRAVVGAEEDVRDAGEEAVRGDRERAADAAGKMNLDEPGRWRAGVAAGRVGCLVEHLAGARCRRKRVEVEPVLVGADDRHLAAAARRRVRDVVIADRGAAAVRRDRDDGDVTAEERRDLGRRRIPWDGADRDAAERDAVRRLRDVEARRRLRRGDALNDISARGSRRGHGDRRRERVLEVDRRLQRDQVGAAGAGRAVGGERAGAGRRQ